MSWSAFELPKVPGAVTSASAGLDKVSGAATTVMEILKTAVEILAAIDVSGLSPSQIVIKSAITAVEEAVKSLVDDTGASVLLVPVRRRVVLSPLVEAALSSVGLPGLPAGQPTASLAKLQAETVTVKSAGSAVARLLLNSSSANGGNAGFLRTVAESLDDSGDASRPQFGINDAVAGFYIVAGSSDYTKLLGLSAALDALFTPGRSSSTLESPGLPVPQNLRVKVSPTKIGKVAARLEWDSQAPIVSVPTLGDTTAQVTQVCVLRSRSASLMSKSTVQEIFGTGNISKGQKIGTDDEEVVVVDVFDYEDLDIKSSYYDESVLEVGKPYYYAVGFNVKAGSRVDILDGSAPAMGFRRISNTAKIHYTAQVQRSGAGSAPDWSRTPSVLDLLPDLAGLVRQLLVSVQQFGATAGGYGDVLRTYSKFLEQETRNFQSLTGDISAKVGRMSAISQSTTGVGTYFKTFSGIGGTQFLLSDLAHSLSDASDSDRPPFDSGDEFVLGVVVMAGAPTHAGLAKTKALIDLLFGSSGGGTSPVAAAVDAIEAAVSEAESQFVLAGPPDETKPLVGADDDGVKDLNCPMPVVSNPVFGDDFKPKE